MTTTDSKDYWRTAREWGTRNSKGQGGTAKDKGGKQGKPGARFREEQRKAVRYRDSKSYGGKGTDNRAIKCHELSVTLDFHTLPPHIVFAEKNHILGNQKRKHTVPT